MWETCECFYGTMVLIPDKPLRLASSPSQLVLQWWDLGNQEYNWVSREELPQQQRIQDRTFPLQTYCKQLGILSTQPSTWHRRYPVNAVSSLGHLCSICSQSQPLSSGQGRVWMLSMLCRTLTQGSRAVSDHYSSFHYCHVFYWSCIEIFFQHFKMRLLLQQIPDPNIWWIINNCVGFFFFLILILKINK